MISPFNFPAMVPLWFVPIAIACGNSVVLKPSEKDPSASLLLAELWAEAGLPDGVFNVVHGDNELVAKIGARMARLHVGDGRRAGCEMGPLVTAAHRDRVLSYVDAGVGAGAELVVDGRGQDVDGDPGGFWLGPTLFDQVRPDMSIYTDEIFGPVLSVVRTASYQAAVDLVNANSYGNGTAIFTSDGRAARRYQNEIEVGMVGVNVPIPVPVGYYSFGGWKNSLFGDTHAYGPDGIHFFTRTKVVTSRWPEQSAGVNLHFPRN